MVAELDGVFVKDGLVTVVYRDCEPLREGASARGYKAMDAVRAASRVSMWLLVQDHHPLALADGASPLSELNAAMRDDCVSIGVLPYAMVEGRVVLESSSVWR